MKKQNNISRAQLDSIIDEGYTNIESKLWNILKNDLPSLQVCMKTVQDWKNELNSTIEKLLQDWVNDKQQLEKLCDEVKSLFESVIKAWIRSWRRKWRAAENNISAVKKEIMAQQKHIAANFSLPQKSSLPKTKEEYHKYNARQQLISQINANEELSCDNVADFFTDKIHGMWLLLLEDFYLAIEEKVLTTKPEKKYLEFIELLFSDLYDFIHQQISEIENDPHLNFFAIQELFKHEEIKQYYNKKMYVLCESDKKKERILRYFINNIVWGAEMFSSGSSLQNFLEEIDQLETQPITLQDLQENFVNTKPLELSSEEKSTIVDMYNNDKKIDTIVQAINTIFYGGLSIRDKEDIIISLWEAFREETETEIDTNISSESDTTIPHSIAQKDEDSKEDIEDSSSYEETHLSEIIEKPKTSNINDVPSHSDNSHPPLSRWSNSEIWEILSQIQNTRQTLENEVKQIWVLEALVDFQQRLIKKIEENEEKLNVSEAQFEDFVEQINTLLSKLERINEDLANAYHYLESESASIKYALSGTRKSDQTQELVSRYKESITIYEKSISQFDLIKDHTHSIPQKARVFTNQYKQAEQFLVKWIYNQLIWVSPESLIWRKIKISTSDTKIDFTWLSQKIRRIEEYILEISNMIEDTPFTQSLQKDIEKYDPSSKPQKPKVTKKLVISNSDPIDSQDTHNKISNIDLNTLQKSEIQILRVLAAAAPHPARGQSFWKPISLIVKFINIAYPWNDNPLKNVANPEQFLTTMLDHIANKSFNTPSKRPPNKEQRENNTNFVMRWKKTNHSNAYFIPYDWLEMLHNFHDGSELDSQQLSNIEQERMAQQEAFTQNRKSS